MTLPEDAEKFNELSPRVKEMLRRLNEREVATLEYVATLERDELRGMLKTYYDIRAVSKFFRWLIITILGVAAGTVLFYRSVAEMITWFQGKG